MGNSVQLLSDRVSLIASNDTWMEGTAIQQLLKTAELPHMHRVAGMPDLHPGRGYPVGAAFFSVGHIYPALVGNDIGCGMGLWQTDLPLHKVNIDKLSKRLGDVEQPLDDSWGDLLGQRKQDQAIHCHEFDTSLGTIGGGNHFTEFQAIDDVFDSAALEALGLERKRLLLLVHSGSRGLGQRILTEHVSRFNHQGLAAGTAGFDDYLQQHDQAVRWAELNREMIARRFLQAIRAEGEVLFDINHNLVSSKTLDGTAGWLHRKGATPADQGLVVIPGSRGDHTYLVKPLESSAGLYSLAHGAGRKWQRGDCKARLSHKYSRDELYRTAFGSLVICGDRTLLYDEAPQAYKPCLSIIEALQDAGLIEVVARLKPVLTFKTHGECSA